MSDMNRSRIVPLVGERIAAGETHHMRAGLQFEAEGLLVRQMESPLCTLRRAGVRRFTSVDRSYRNQRACRLVEAGPRRQQ